MNELLEKVAAQSGPGPDGWPAWFQALRTEGANQFRAHGLPHTRLEDWKYTSLKALEKRLDAAGSDKSPVCPSADAKDWNVESPLSIGLASDGTVELEGDLPAGITVMSLMEAAQNDAGRLRSLLEALNVDQPARALNALNTADLSAGFLVHVAPGVDAGRITFQVGAPSLSPVSNPRVCLVLDEAARLEWVELFTVDDSTALAINLVNQIELGERAQLTHVSAQQGTASQSLFTRTEIYQADESFYKQTSVDLGQGLARHDSVVRLAGQGASVELLGAYLPQGNAHVDHHLWIEHEALNCSSKQLYRGVLDDRSRAVFSGRVHVHPGADGSDAEQSNANLLLSIDAEVDTKPELVIEADEVVASHGATVGQLDDIAVFYLRSRGLTEAQARKLLTAAFCQAVIDDLDSPDLRDIFTTALAVSLESKL